MILSSCYKISCLRRVTKNIILTRNWNHYYFAKFNFQTISRYIKEKYILITILSSLSNKWLLLYFIDVLKSICIKLKSFKVIKVHQNNIGFNPLKWLF